MYKSFIIFALTLLSGNTYLNAAVCYAISSAGNELHISVIADQDYTVAPNNYWVTGNVTLSWPQALGTSVAGAVSGQNGFGFAADGPAYLNGGLYFQKFGFTTTSPVVRALTANTPVLVMIVTVAHPTIPTGDFSIAEQPGTPPVNAFASFNNVFSEQFGAGGCNLVSASVPLPVELLQFDARPQTDWIALNWTVATEKNLDHYEVERSTDGQTFSPIARQDARWQGASSTRYEYADRAVQTGVLYYYRLKMLEQNGSATYSGIRIAQLNGRKSITIAPNPAQEQVRFSWNDNTVTAITVTDINGREVLTQHQVAATLSLSGLPDGVYVLRFSCADAPPQYVRLVKQ